MAYRIFYFRQGTCYRDGYSIRELSKTRVAAKRALKRDKADYAAIIDLKTGMVADRVRDFTRAGDGIKPEA